MNAPRIMIASSGSGSGKTTITCALLMQLLKRQIKAESFKCGPDYIDPVFHERVLGIPSRNLDPFFSDERQLRALFLNGLTGQEFSVIEGVMGLYDGIVPENDRCSSYEVAKELDIPIILVIDAHGMGRSVIPLIAGFLKYDECHLIKGVILNRTVRSYYSMLAPVIEGELGIRAYGCLPPESDIGIESRHLGLVLPSGNEAEIIRDKLCTAGELLEENADIDGIITLMHSASPLNMLPDEIDMNIFGDIRRQVKKDRIRIAVARDEAFCFDYRVNMRILERLGAELVYFSPLHDKTLPEDINGLILGGGYPELYAKELADNISMRDAVRTAVNGGLPSLAECGGFMYLHKKLSDKAGNIYPMTDVIHADTFYTGHLVRFGYVSLSERNAHFLPGNRTIRGHEFHYYDSTAAGSDCIAVKAGSGRSYRCILESDDHCWGFPHLYYASDISFAEHFAVECRKKKV